mgnify:CR=1 FL=1
MTQRRNIVVVTIMNIRKKQKVWYYGRSSVGSRIFDAFNILLMLLIGGLMLRSMVNGAIKEAASLAGWPGVMTITMAPVIMLCLFFSFDRRNRADF